MFLDEEEKKWLLKNAQRKFTMFSNLPEREKRHKIREVNCWANIIDEVTTPKNEFFNFTRQQGRLMQDLVIEMIAVLGNRTIPAYNARLNKEPALQPYVDKCNALLTGLLSLSDKLQKALA